MDIGFEKNAFLHYWDIVPNNFDSGVEIVDRDGQRRDRPKITQKDIPRRLPAGQRHHRASHQRPDRHQRPAGHHQPRPAGPLPGPAAQFRPERHLRKIENQQERQRLKKILRELSIPDGMGVIMRTVGEGQQKRYFVRDLALLLEEWNRIRGSIKIQPPGYLRLPGTRPASSARCATS